MTARTGGVVHYHAVSLCSCEFEEMPNKPVAISTTQQLTVLGLDSARLELGHGVDFAELNLVLHFWVPLESSFEMSSLPVGTAEIDNGLPVHKGCSAVV